MKLFSKFLAICVLCLLLNSVFASPAYSRGGGGGGGCFTAGTIIATPQGTRAIEQLHQGDKVTSYNFSQHKQELGTISQIEILEADSYYRLNDRTLVTATHPFYRQTANKIELVEVAKLKIGDRLITEDGKTTKITSLDKISESVLVYNLLAIEPNHNFYADGFLVHNKGGGGGGGGSFGRGGSGHEVQLNPGFFLALLLLCSGMLIVAFTPDIIGYLNYFKQEFATEEELITYTQQIKPEFTNKYSSHYRPDDQIWKQIDPPTELEAARYQHLISKTALITETNKLFAQYQHHWTIRDLPAMKQYVTEPFYSIQETIFRQTVGIDFDIVYKPQLEQIVPVDIESNSEKYFIRLLISGSMTNFKLSATTGNILSGTPQPRFFSEYWDIEIRKKPSWDTTTEPKIQCYLANISQVA